ncbi:cytochrome c oxidase subunit 4 [Kineosporia sp. J2-2]|uniref:Cytochrome c oxidase polypeptide 4 n=1 Tax=Kineosporia corallincola TaxID=2835133 RepID=A0ABS5TIW1_9ACTN|nr:cytochrome c oxidase subunit 4 [Kineosporia corallincola]MBT0771012.1 cytochrome c oxidase subunit 4 [Kineosporia corallincola]
MKIESWLFLGGTPIFILFGVVYGSVTSWTEPVGAAALLMTGGLSVLVGAYLAYTARHIDPRPEDNPYGEIAEGAGELGEFAPHSWWPLVASAAAAVLVVGTVIGWWLMAIGVLIAAIGIWGWVFEFYRGEHAH